SRLRQQGALERRWRAYGVVEALDAHAPVRTLDRRQRPDELPGRVGHQPGAGGVEILAAAVGAHLHEEEAGGAEADARHIAGVEAAVEREGGIGRQQVAVALNESGQARAAA